MADALLALVVVLIATYAIEIFFVMRFLRSPVVAVNLLLAPFWTLLGAIPILLTKQSSPTDSATYLERELFTLLPDRVYLQVILAYGAFLVLYPMVVLVFGSRILKEKQFDRAEWKRYAGSFVHLPLAVEAAVLGSVAVGLVVMEQRRLGNSNLYTANLYLSERWINYLVTAVVVCLIVGISLFIAAGWESVRRHRLAVAIYTASFLLLVYTNWSLGRRNLMFTFAFGLVVAWITYGSRRSRELPSRQILRWALTLLAAGCILFISGVAGVTRGGMIGNSWQSQSSEFLKGLSNLPLLWQTVARQGEWYASHMSLYGVISYEVNWQGYFSLPYSIYAQAVGASSDVGYTIHPVAALWIYVGPIAPLVAACVLGGVTSICLALSLSSPNSVSAFAAIPCATLGSFAVPAVLLRGGPEGVWGLFLMLILIPSLVLALPTWQTRKVYRVAS